MGAPYLTRSLRQMWDSTNIDAVENDAFVSGISEPVKPSYRVFRSLFSR
jgi:hypothetical protein